jgi:DNA polymerase-3 subunit epsilon
LFSAMAEEFLAFIGDAPLVIHNASFDIKFINAELARVSHPPIPLSRAIDTIEIAKRKIPGARYSLDELCRRFGVDLTARTKHGALLDADLTAQIYLELIGGRQRGLALAPVEIVETALVMVETSRIRPHKLEPLLTAEELAAHTAFVAKELGGKSLWAGA